MLEMTKTAIDLINHLAPGEAGLPVYKSGGERDAEALQVEIADAPKPDDQVVEADGAHVFLEPRAADTLDDKSARRGAGRAQCSLRRDPAAPDRASSGRGRQLGLPTDDRGRGDKRRGRSPA